MTDPRSDPSNRRPAPEAPAGGTLLFALIVGLSPEEETVAREVLGAAGFDLRRAKDGLDAVRTAIHTDIDLIVTAIDMAGLDGLQLMQLVQRGLFGSPPPPIIACVGDSDMRVFWERREEGSYAAAVRRPVEARDLRHGLDLAFPTERSPAT
jgi:CheY-like chemotaxis protein